MSDTPARREHEEGHARDTTRAGGAHDAAAHESGAHEAAAHESLRQLLYATFRAQPQPVLASRAYTIPAASLWAGARVWLEHVRRLGLQPGDRVALALPRTPAHVEATLAAWWAGLTVCPAPEHAAQDDPGGVLTETDARLLLACVDHPHAIAPDEGHIPEEHTRATARDGGASTPGVAVLALTRSADRALRLAGATGGAAASSPRRVAINYGALLAHLTTLPAAIPSTHDDVALSTNHWHTGIGMLVDLWPALLRGVTLRVMLDDLHDPDAVVNECRAWGVTDATLLPEAARDLASCAAAGETLRALRGVVGGAPLNADLCSALRGSALQVIYTPGEACFAAALGAPGEFARGWLGRPLGCHATVIDGELHLRGPRVTPLARHTSALPAAAPAPDADAGAPWTPTGDLVAEHAGGFVFRGVVMRGGTTAAARAAA